MSRFTRFKTLLYLVLVATVVDTVFQILVLVPWENVNGDFLLVIHSQEIKIFTCVVFILNILSLSYTIKDFYNKTDVLLIEDDNFEYDGD